jgi:hypothetical protein
MLTALATCPRREVVGLMFLDVGTRALDDRRLGVFLLDENLIAQHGQMLRKDREQFDRGFMLF